MLKFLTFNTLSVYTVLLQQEAMLKKIREQLSQKWVKSFIKLALRTLDSANF